MSTFSLTFPYSRQRTRNSTGVYSVSQTLLVGKIRFAAIKIELVTIPVDVALPSHMSALPPPPMSPSCPRPSDNFPSSSFDLQNRNFSPQLWNRLVSAFDPNFCLENGAFKFRILGVRLMIFESSSESSKIPGLLVHAVSVP